jgi:hypothetical protein
MILLFGDEILAHFGWLLGSLVPILFGDEILAHFGWLLGSLVPILLTGNAAWMSNQHTGR